MQHEATDLLQSNHELCKTPEGPMERLPTWWLHVMGDNRRSAKGGIAADRIWGAHRRSAGFRIARHAMTLNSCSATSITAGLSFSSTAATHFRRV
jgi:hypothetical protein